MGDGPAVVVPGAGFVPYRYINLATWVTGSVFSMVWILPLAYPPFPSAEYSAGVWTTFVGWTLGAVVWATVAVTWIPRYARSLRYVFETDNLVAHAGVWFRSRAYVPYARITDIAVRQGPLERRFGLHRLMVQTAGSSVPEATLLGITDPDRVREMLFRRTLRSPDTPST